MHIVLMDIIATPYFERRCKKLLSEKERAVLLATLEADPLAGSVVRGTGGIRKMRLAREGGGKSGGYRIIYFFYDVAHPLWLLDVYPKNTQEELTPEQEKVLGKLAKELKAGYKK
jgi:hypothetical protein